MYYYMRKYLNILLTFQMYIFVICTYFTSCMIRHKTTTLVYYTERCNEKSDPGFTLLLYIYLFRYDKNVFITVYDEFLPL